MTLEHAKALYHILAPLEGIEPMQLRRVAAHLVGQGGQHTACGRCLERALEHLYPNAPKPKPRKKIGFEEGYGGMTFPLGSNK